MIQHHILSKSVFHGLCGRFEDPLTHMRAATLICAILLASVAVPIVLFYPKTLHILKIDLPPPGHVPNFPEPGRPFERFELKERGLFVNGVRCDRLQDLHMVIDVLEQRAPTPEIQLRVDPEVKHERFLLALAAIKQSNPTFFRLMLDPMDMNRLDYANSNTDLLPFLPWDLDPESEANQSTWAGNKALKESQPIKPVPLSCAAQFGVDSPPPEPLGFTL